MKENGISVVIPVYNAEKTIEKCINSIRNQTFTNLQIICVNDGSRDNSLEILLEMSKNDERIEVYSQKNSGPGAARNVGIAHANRKYITFVDSDDVIDSEMYSKMFTLIKNNNLDCVICDIKVICPENKTEYIITPIKEDTISGDDNILEYIIKPLIEYNKEPSDGFASMCNKLFHTTIIRNNNLRVDTKRNHGEDWKFCINYFRFVQSVGFIHEPLYHYIHTNGESLLSAFQPQFLEMRLESETLFRKWFTNLDWNSKEQIEKLLVLPIKAAEYYRVHLENIHLEKKLNSIYFICVNDENYMKYAQKNDTWKNLVNNKDKFTRYIWKSSTKAVIMYKVKKLVKKILHRK